MINNLIKKTFFIIFLFFSNNAFCLDYQDNHEFEIFRNNKKIGYHKLSFKNIEDKTIVNTEIKMVVKLGIIPVFQYFHKAEEVWLGNKFIEANTRTKKNSREFELKAIRKGSKIEINSRGKIFFIDGDSLITSYWQKNWLNKKILIDSQHGKKRLINVKKKNIETITTSFGEISAQKYLVTGTKEKLKGKKIDYDIWYDEKNRWVKLKFLIKNSLIEYFLVTKY